MSQLLEPTYLRYIHDGLIQGSIHPENAADLPDGLIGIFEEAFDERSSVVERQKLLKRFAIWALLKKEVNAVFVAEILGEAEDSIQEFISTYSVWFNSPESGKYQLYHERLKVYLLQKMSEGEIHTLHEKLISRLEQAIEEQKSDEFEWYALEFLVGHIAVTSMISGEGKQLIDLAYSQTHWQRQLKISKGYTWTKNSLKEVMTWASKYNEDEVIECGLQMVDLYYQEQNAAPQIVTLVTEGEFDAALKRIEQFGGSDKDGLQRKFILYMLCLMELTLLESKGKPFQKEGIENLLKHLDDHLPVDHTVLNWSDFFPSYLMFQMACEWANLRLDYLKVYKKTKEWETDWIAMKGPFNKFQFDILIACAHSISSPKYKSAALVDIGAEFFKQGFSVEAKKIIDESVDFAKSIIDYRDKCFAFAQISTELFNQNLNRDAFINIQVSLEFMRLITDKVQKSSALEYISIELAKQSMANEAFACARYIPIEEKKCNSLAKISTEFHRQGDTYLASQALKEALVISQKINDSYIKYLALRSISIEYAKQGKEEAFVIINRINDKKYKDHTLACILIEFAKLGNIEKAKLHIEFFNDEDDLYTYIQLLESITTGLILQGKIKEALIYLKEKSINKSINLIYIYKRLFNYFSDNFISFEFYISIVEYLQFELVEYSEILAEISIEYSKHGKIDEAFKFINMIKSNQLKFDSYAIISSELARQGKIEDSIKLALCIEDDYYKCCLFSQISTELFNHGKDYESRIFMKKAIQFQVSINDDSDFCDSIINISIELAKQKKIIESMNMVRELSDESDIISAYTNISKELTKKGALQEALKIARTIKDEFEKCSSFLFICRGYYEAGNNVEANIIIQEALSYINIIDSFKFKSILFALISTEYHVLNNYLENKFYIDKSLKCAKKIKNINDKNNALLVISNQFFIQGKLEDALNCLVEINDISIKDSFLEKISVELLKHDDLNMSENIANKIKSSARRQEFWIKNSEHFLFSNKSQLLFINNKYESEEAKSFFLKGVCKKIEIKNVNIEFVVYLLPYLTNDIFDIIQILRKYALNEIFIKQVSKDFINRINKTLNIQWAIDIKNNFSHQ